MAGTDMQAPRLLGTDRLSHLPLQKRMLFIEDWNSFVNYIETEGKDPELGRGYAESNVRPIARRLLQVLEYLWNRGSTAVKIGPNAADRFVESLSNDEYRAKSGNPYTASSKRKFIGALKTYFEYQEDNWQPQISFVDSGPNNPSDPFSISERQDLINAAFDYRSPPSYGNVSPEERDRWKAYLAQELGRPKSDIGPDAWSAIRSNWKYPALISSTLDAGWRAAMVGRLKVDHLDLEHGRVTIPPDVAVKNNQHWVVEITERSVKMLRRWVNQRKNIKKYDGSSHLFLNRKSNPYTSGPLNNLLENLIKQSEIEPNGRRLTWHSIRHSTGMYIYDETNDLGLVAEILRHSTLKSARRYAHPTPETKTDLIERLQKRNRQ